MRQLLIILALALSLAAQTKDTAPRGLTSVTFANLGTPANGTIVYCSDCQSTSPTVGSGSGAVVRRENGAWNSGGGGGGGGASITQGTFASLPGTCTTNDLYLITDSPITTARCSAANTWSYFASFGQVTPPVLGSFTCPNGGTTDTTRGGIILNAPASGTHNIRYCYIAAPATPYAIMMAYTYTGDMSNYFEAGLGFLDTIPVTFDLYGLDYTNDGPRQGHLHYTGVTVTSGAVVNGNLPWAREFSYGNIKFACIIDDGTNHKNKLSSDNQNYFEYQTESRTAYLANGGDKVLFYVDPNNSVAGSIWVLGWVQTAGTCP